MPYVSSTGTYLPCWGDRQHRVPGDDEVAREAFMTSVAGAGGVLPVNSGRDLKAKRPPWSTTGVAKCIELVGQLRGEVTQVDGARVALAYNTGDPTAISAVTILEGPGGHGR
jgi:acetyl-CoA C-acetyltransferase